MIDNIVVLLGPPGSGKTTQARLLSGIFRCPTIAGDEIQQLRAGGLIVDGYPGTVAEAVRFDNLLKQFGVAQPTFIYLDVPDTVSHDRLTGRLECALCGRVYHRRHSPSTLDRYCENDDMPLVQRTDDSGGNVRKRLLQDASTDLREYYGSALRVVSATASPCAVLEAIEAALNTHAPVAA